MTKLEQIQQLALELSQKERGELASWLLRQLDDEVADNPEEVEEAWNKEIARRVKEIENGTAKTIPGEQVMKEIRERFKIDL
jgi:putative addiction module component (TIGR02574 family)